MKASRRSRMSAGWGSPDVRYELWIAFDIWSNCRKIEPSSKAKKDVNMDLT